MPTQVVIITIEATHLLYKVKLSSITSLKCEDELHIFYKLQILYIKSHVDTISRIECIYFPLSSNSVQC